MIHVQYAVFTVKKSTDIAQKHLNRVKFCFYRCYPPSQCSKDKKNWGGGGNYLKKSTEFNLQTATEHCIVISWQFKLGFLLHLSSFGGVQLCIMLTVYNW